jgi:SAM-dependent methyltransferase
VRPKDSFIFQGANYRYFYHSYNRTWRNERAVEIPIIRNIAKENEAKTILEVGNVLSHYFHIDHDIIDKYEKAKAVINEDVVNFHPSKKYDLIISISTLEHVGWDEDPRDPSKVIRAIENLLELLSPGGKIIVTLPLGYNNELDKFLKERRLALDKQYYLKRISKSNKWIETTWDDVCGAKYGKPFPNANALIIGIIERK